MSQARRRKVEDSKQESKSSVSKKKVKLEDGAPGITAAVSVEWENELGSGKWKKHPPEQKKIITEAFMSGKESVNIDDKKTTYSIQFDSMMQRNVKTGWEKRIRCVSSVDGYDPEEYKWQFQQGRGKWTSYTESPACHLEAAYLCGLSTCSFLAHSKMHSVDLKKMVVKTGKSASSQKLRRIKGDEAESDISTSGPVEDSKQEKSSRVKKEKGKVCNDVKTEEPKQETPVVKSLVFSGKAPVDSFCSLKDKVHVFCEQNDIWDCMLNQTNVMNNNNKYYLIQLLEDNRAKKFYVWQRWGRVGFDGQNNLVTCGGDLEQAKKIFEKKFLDKTKNHWDERKNFEKVPGKYDLLIMDYEADDQQDQVDAPVKKEKNPVKESTLEKRVQLLIELICNVKAMEEMLKEMKYDTQKAPLGKLTTDQIKAGYQALKSIDECIRKNDFGSKLVKACDEFYTRVPHCFGMKRPPLIRTKDEVQIKLQLLEALGDIQIAVKAMEEEDEGSSEHPLDKHYKSLHCELTPVDEDHEDFKMIDKYIQNSHGTTHNQYSMKILSVFAVKHENQNFKDVGNRMLLWHGSRLTNWVGILSRGLRIAPPEAPVTGYMFGKGVYFADMSSKSANYCFATRSKNVGIVLLSEVSLGKSNELLASDYNAATLPPDCHSVKALGKIAPDPGDNFTMSDGVLVPLGKSRESGVVNPNGYTLQYNEYVVYDTDQIRMRYLVQVQFNFK